MPKVFIVANEIEPVRKLRTDLIQRGLDCLIIPSKDGIVEQIATQSPGLMLLDTDEVTVGSETWELAQRMRRDKNMHLVALVSRDVVNGFCSSDDIDDFVVKPWEATEVAARIKRILRPKEGIDGEDIIRSGDLIIDSDKCEVSLGGKPIVLTFKEYQLLKFLASNRGKVFRRDVLLDKVWGWDYYGGDRTVDVHVRRLRSKIEDSTHTFIDTVRNIGYKFREF